MYEASEGEYNGEVSWVTRGEFRVREGDLHKAVMCLEFAQANARIVPGIVDPGSLGLAPGIDATPTGRREVRLAP